MKIIKSGKSKLIKPIRRKCKSCGCQVEFNRNEVLVSDGPRYDDRFEYVKCPECSYFIYV